MHGIRPQMTSDLMSKLIFFFTFLRKHNIQTMIWMEKPAVYQRSPEAWFCFNCPFKNETKVYDFSQFITTHPQKSKWIDFQSNTLTKMTCDSKSQFRTKTYCLCTFHKVFQLLTSSFSSNPKHPWNKHWGVNILYIIGITVEIKTDSLLKLI